jgi:hypothetical protein
MEVVEVVEGVVDALRAKVPVKMNAVMYIA